MLLSVPAEGEVVAQANCLRSLYEASYIIGIITEFIYMSYAFTVVFLLFFLREFFSLSSKKAQTYKKKLYADTTNTPRQIENIRFLPLHELAICKQNKIYKSSHSVTCDG